MTGDVAFVAIKAVGAVAGSALALIYMQPKTLAEFTTRSVFSVICGFVWSEAVREYLKWPLTMNYELAASSLTALLSWFVMSNVVGIIQKWNPPK